MFISEILQRSLFMLKTAHNIIDFPNTFVHSDIMQLEIYKIISCRTVFQDHSKLCFFLKCTNKHYNHWYYWIMLTFKCLVSNLLTFVLQKKLFILFSFLVNNSSIDFLNNVKSFIYKFIDLESFKNSNSIHLFKSTSVLYNSSYLIFLLI